MRSRKLLWALEIMFMAVLLSSSTVFAADPGHRAPAISTGTFESGNYTFPASLFVTDFFGLGRTAPSAKLDILHDQDALSQIRFENTLNTSSARAVFFINANNTQIFVEALPENNTVLPAWAGAAVLGANKDLFVGPYTSHSIYFQTGGVGTKRVTIDTGGLVGIGTTAPQSLLHLNSTNGTLLMITSSIADGNSSLAFTEGGTAAGISLDYMGTFNELRFRDFSSGTNLLTIERAGNVGINTTSPADTLTVQGTANISGTLNLTGILSVGGQKIIGVATPTDATDAATKAYVDSLTCGISGGKSSLSTRVGTNVYLNNTGDNVGIGTTEPTQKLNIVGSGATRLVI